jgi:hypothetical protein
MGYLSLAFGGLAMNSVLLREQLHQQVEQLPEDLLSEIAEFILFKLARRARTSRYTGWSEHEWQDFAIDHLPRETEDDVEYSLDDAEVVYRP